MARSKEQHPFEPHPDWIAALRGAMKMVEKPRGRKAAMLRRAGISKSHENRLANEPEKLGHDALEKLRSRSMPHYRWCEIGGTVDEGLEHLVEWVEIGRRLLAIDRLPQGIDWADQLVEGWESSARENARSSDSRKVSEPLPRASKTTSDRPGKPVHHGDRERR